LSALEQEFLAWERSHGYPQPGVLPARPRRPRVNPPPRTRRGIFFPEKATRLIYAAACVHEESAWSLLLHLELGLSRAELCAIRPQHADFEHGVVQVQGRLIGLSEAAAAAAAWLLEHRPGPTLLGVSPGVFSNRITRAARRAGLSSTAGHDVLWPTAKRDLDTPRPMLRAVPPLDAPVEEVRGERRVAVELL
jgi:integrase